MVLKKDSFTPVTFYFDPVFMLFYKGRFFFFEKTGGARPLLKN
jgi:hypothetical protein